MKKTYITTMPNHIGAFLKASECFAALGINITQVSYNKAVDSHTLFIDAERHCCLAFLTYPYDAVSTAVPASIVLLSE